MAQGTWGVSNNPITSVNWRRHQSGCPFYRVRWLPENDFVGGEPMYQVFCGKDTPPTSQEEQERCLASKAICWRVAEARRVASDEPIPLDQVRRRRPA